MCVWTVEELAWRATTMRGMYESIFFIIIGNFTKYAMYISEGARNKCNKKYMFSKKRYMIQVYGGDKWNSKSDENDKNWLQKVQLTCG
jgi:hypothetical protein